VTYPVDRFEGGPCPAGFKRIPNLFLEAYYKVKCEKPRVLPSEADRSECARLRVVPRLSCFVSFYSSPSLRILAQSRANGDNYGLSYHSDWLNGWPSGMLVDAVNSDECRLDGTPDGCPIFEKSRDEKKSGDCVAQGQLVNEVRRLSRPIF
jgi:hypothetical protein